MLSVTLPLNEALLLHVRVATMGSVTVRRVEGISPVLGLV